MSSNKREIAANTHLCLCFALYLFFILMSVFSVQEGKLGLSVGFAAANLLPLFVFLISPMYYIFSADGVEIIYLWGQKEEIKWTSVRTVTLFGSWISRGGAMPHYHLAYSTNKKRVFFACGDISKTRKTKKLIKKYYKNHII